MNWSVLNFNDVKNLFQNVENTDLEGSDCSPVNLFLLQKKYDIKTCAEKGFLFRYYTGNANRTGYGFPLKLTDSKNELKDALELIIQDAEENKRSVKFCLVSEKQKNLISECAEKYFPELKLSWISERDDCDYVYSREKLAALAGKTYHKKKNHVSKFLRTYEGKWEFRLYSLCQVADDIVKVSEEWLKERFDSGIEEDRKILEMELDSIKIAVQNKETFGIEGGVLYVDGKPVAMTLASKISEKILDVHYEKCLSEVAQFGAYAVINWCFANAVEKFEYLNREEDMGVEGLRKAKLSYHPDILLEKFYTN